MRWPRLNHERSGPSDDSQPDPLSLPPGTLVDVLYDDDLTYRTVRRDHVDWRDPRKMPAIWRTHDPNSLEPR